jgi:hypothetical protein
MELQCRHTHWLSVNYDRVSSCDSWISHRQIININNHNRKHNEIGFYSTGHIHIITCKINLCSKHKQQETNTCLQGKSTGYVWRYQRANYQRWIKIGGLYYIKRILFLFLLLIFKHMNVYYYHCMYRLYRNLLLYK